MSLINNIIRQAKADPRPTEITIPANQVDAVAEHVRAIVSHWEDRDIDQIRAMLLAGKIKLLEVPLRVIGSSA